MASNHSQQTTPTMEDPSQQQQQITNNDSNNTNTSSANATKRKPSRRANTAERRATHNAVERARRETLNGRFLDLAQLLPNLSQIRRPSKSAIVNSSIAHINASRRHRLLASRELRAMKNEADALRRELNEWRDRANLPRLEEPPRGEGFSMVLSGELEVINISTSEDDELDEDGVAYGDEMQAQQNYYPEQQEIAPQQIFSHSMPPTPPTSSHGHPQAAHGQVQLHNVMPRQAPQNLHPMVVSPTAQVHFDPAHPSNMHGMPQFAHNAHPQSPHAMHFHEQPMVITEQEKAYNMGFAAAQRSLHNSPSHFAHAPVTSNAAQQQGWNDFLSDDASSASSQSQGGRARSGSLSTGFGSPPRSPGSFELGSGGYDGGYDAPGANGDYGVPRGLSINTTGINMGAAPPQMMASPVGGGGNFGNVMMGCI